MRRVVVVMDHVIFAVLDDLSRLVPAHVSPFSVSFTHMSSSSFFPSNLSFLSVLPPILSWLS